MSTKRQGLGRNLSALLSHSSSEHNTSKSTQQEENNLLTLPINQLQPGKYQPRGDIDENALLELAESIKKQGLLQPILIRAISPNAYEIIAGERRWRACQIAEMKEVPVVIRQVDDETAMAMALIENLQREDLNAMDQARAMLRLTDEFALTHQQVAELLCKSRTAVSNYLRLLHLNPDVGKMLEYGDLDMGHARCLLMLEKEKQSQVAQLIVAKNLSVRETESLVNRVKAGVTAKENAPEPAPLFQEQLQTLSKHLRTKIKLKHGQSGKGTLIIHYEDTHNLEKMMNQLLDLPCQ